MVEQAFRFFRRSQDEKRTVLVSPQHRGFILAEIFARL